MSDAEVKAYTAEEFDGWLANREKDAAERPTSSETCTWKCDAYGHHDDCLRDAWNAGRASLLSENEKLTAEVARLRGELRITDALLTERERVMNALPECHSHGRGCVPHAVTWIADARRTLDESTDGKA